jgi:indole-3-glycerol phosphate synthase
LSTVLLRSLRQKIEDLGMDALVEVHDQRDLDRALEAGATFIGVNNRDLRTFEVSLETSLALAPRLPGNVLAISESGIRTVDDVRRLAGAGYSGFLVGEILMKAASPGAALRELMTALRPAGGRAR